MIRLALAAALALPSSALAQHHGHHAPAPSRAPSKPSDPHAGHQMPAPQSEPDPHAGHQMPEFESDPHAGHGATARSPPIGPPPPGALAGPAHAADTVFDPAQMASAREELRVEHGGMAHGKLLIDRFETRLRGGRNGYAWDAEGWYGGDIDKLWLKTEGEGAFGSAVEQAEVQALWSHAVDPYFDLQAGLRHDLRPRPDCTHLVLGLQGLAPYWIEIDAAAFLSDKGDLTARIEAEHDARITQRLILQPRVEFEFSAQDVPELGLGSGLTNAELGLRLRYELDSRFAPYAGVEYERAFGDIADFRRATAEEAGGWTFLVGLRGWF